MPTNTAPQSVSRRYAFNLLLRGANKTYEVEAVSQQVAKTAKGLPCGYYYKAIIKTRVGGLFDPYEGEGVTPIDAMIDALVSAGVTFR